MRGETGRKSGHLLCMRNSLSQSVAVAVGKCWPVSKLDIDGVCLATPSLPVMWYTCSPPPSGSSLSLCLPHSRGLGGRAGEGGPSPQTLQPASGVRAPP